MSKATMQRARRQVKARLPLSHAKTKDIASKLRSYLRHLEKEYKKAKKKFPRDPDWRDDWDACDFFAATAKWVEMVRAESVGQPRIDRTIRLTEDDRTFLDEIEERLGQATGRRANHGEMVVVAITRPQHSRTKERFTARTAICLSPKAHGLLKSICGRLSRIFDDNCTPSRALQVASERLIQEPLKRRRKLLKECAALGESRSKQISVTLRAERGYEGKLLVLPTDRQLEEHNGDGPPKVSRSLFMETAIRFLHTRSPRK